MKRILIVIIAIMICSTAALANFYIDGMLVSNDTGDTKNQTGLGIKLACSITQDLNIFLRQIVTTATEDPDTINETEYLQLQGLLGGEYVYRFEQYPLAMSIGAGIGLTRSEIKPENSGSGVQDLQETGMGYGAWVGMQWFLTQRITPYIEIGYTQSQYAEDFKNAHIGGMQAAIGVRFTLLGKNKSLTDRYE